jgi:hypothetical protein
MDRRKALLPSVVLIAAALACNLSPAAGTLGPADISTLSAQTVAAIQKETAAAQPGNTALPPANPEATTAAPPALPTNTPLPTVTNPPTFTPTVTATAKPCNVATAVDVNVPDNWETTPADHFTKTWRFTNLGTCLWTSGYTLIFDHGDRMGALDSVPVTAGTVSPGGTVDVSVNLLSPNAAGTYRGDFQLHAPDGTLFGHVWVQIKVIVLTLPPPAIMPSVSRVDTNISIAPGAIGSTNATCPAGTVVVSGGFATNPEVHVYTQMKSGNAWIVYAKSNSGASRILNVYANCLTYPGTATSVVSNSGTMAAGVKSHLTVDCPAGSVVTGGGFTGKADGGLLTYNSSQNGNGWQVWNSSTAGSGVLINIYAVCLTGAPVTTTQVTQSLTIPAGANKGESAACPAGRIMVGGGWAMQDDLEAYSSFWSTNKWYGYAHNSGGADRIMFVYGICMTP